LPIVAALATLFHRAGELPALFAHLLFGRE